MKKKIVKIGALVVTAATLLAFNTKTANAHHPEVSVSSVCIEPDESFISITATAWQYWDDGTPVTPDRRANSDVKVYIGNNSGVVSDSWLLVGEGHFGEDNNFSFTSNNVQKNAVGVVTVRVVSIAPWGPNGEYNSLGDTREAVIDLSDDCTATGTTTTVSNRPGTSAPPQATTIVRDITPAEPTPVLPHFTG